jgi:hypothetical protein
MNDMIERLQDTISHNSNTLQSRQRLGEYPQQNLGDYLTQNLGDYGILTTSSNQQDENTDDNK